MKEKKLNQQGKGSMEKKHIKLYYCITCNKVFEIEEGEKPRCPECMSIHSVEPHRRGDGGIRKKQIIIAVIAIVVIITGGVFIYYQVTGRGGRQAESLESKLSLSESELIELLTEKGLEKKNIINPFSISVELEDFVHKNKGSGSWKKMAEKLYSSFIKLKSEAGFLPFITRQPRKTPPMKVADTFEAISRKKKTPLYSIELAILFTDVLRIAKLNSYVVKINDYNDLTRPLDPSGNVGHFATIVCRNEACKDNSYLYDLHQARAHTPQKAEYEILKDSEVVACFLNHRAYYLSGVQFNTKEAVSVIEDALLLYPTSPELHSLRGILFIAGGGIDEGKQEVRKALMLRKDAQRILKWAAITMAEGNPEDALTEIKRALDLKPDYAMAHATAAMAYLAAGEADEAKKQLDIAKKLDPHDPLVPLYEANYYLERGQITKATELAEKAYTRSYGDPQVAILLATLYKQTGEEKKVASVLKKLLDNENIPDEFKSKLTEQFDLDSIEEEEAPALSLGGIEKPKNLLLGPSEKTDEQEPLEPLKLKLKPTPGGLLSGKGSGYNLQLK